MTPRKSQFKSRLKDLETEELVQAENFFTQSDATPKLSSATAISEDAWMATPDGYDGQLAVDVYHDEKNVYIRAIIGGLDPKQLEVHLNNDMVTIKGKRLLPNLTIKPENYFIQECYWGGFSRSVIMPFDIKNDAVEAKIEHGVLLVTLPKSHRPKNTRIPIKAVR